MNQAIVIRMLTKSEAESIIDRKKEKLRRKLEARRKAGDITRRLQQQLPRQQIEAVGMYKQWIERQDPDTVSNSGVPLSLQAERMEKNMQNRGGKLLRAVKLGIDEDHAQRTAEGWANSPSTKHLIRATGSKDSGLSPVTRFAGWVNDGNKAPGRTATLYGADITNPDVPDKFSRRKVKQVMARTTGDFTAGRREALALGERRKEEEEKVGNALFKHLSDPWSVVQVLFTQRGSALGVATSPSEMDSVMDNTRLGNRGTRYS